MPLLCLVTHSNIYWSLFYYVYRFYSGLLEVQNPQLSGEKWIEAQSNLMCSGTAVGICVANHAASDPLSSTKHHTPPAALPINPRIPCINNSPVPSAGVHVAATELEDEVERDGWQAMARDWYKSIMAQG